VKTTTFDRRQVLRYGISGAGLLALGPVLAACSTPGSGTAPAAGGAGGAGTPKKGGTLRFARTTGPTSLDPQAVIVAGDVYTLNQIFEPLYITDGKGALQPHLATGHTVSPDGKTYTFTLRQGVQFSDGTPLTADDVAFSLLRNRDNKGPLSFLNAVITSVKATDPQTVVVALKQPWAPLVSDISAFANSIVPKNLGGKSAAEFFAKPVGTGPFVLQSWTKGGTVVLARNEHYWQPGKPYLDKVEFTIVADDNQLVQQLRGGQVDVIDSVPQANVAELQSGGQVSVLSSDQWSVDLLLFNEKVATFADRHVRRAISHAVNRAQIAKATTFGTAKPAGSFFPPSLQYYDGAAQVLGYDLAAAKAELAQSKFAGGFTTEILVPSSDQAWNQTAQIIQEALKPLNITVKIRSIELAAFKEAFAKFDYEIFINNAINDISDPDEMASFQIDDVNGGSTSYWTHYHNPAAITLVHQAEQEQDDAKRKELYGQIQQIVADDVPYVPLTYPQNLKGLRKAVGGFVVNPAGAVRLDDVWIS
jgi:peptide/nickel transport system substrate-binding protein